MNQKERDIPKSAKVVLVYVLAILLEFTIVNAYLAGAITISSGIYPNATSWTIWVEGSTYYSKNAYGISGLSSTNASEIINSCLATSSGTTFVSTGTYTLTGMIVFLTPNRYLKGAGVGATIFELANGENTESIRVGDLTHSADNTTLSDFTLNGNKAGQTSGHGIRIYSDTQLTHNVWIHHILVEYAYSSGISVDSPSFVEIDNCILQFCGSSGLYFENFGGATVNNIITKNNTNGISINSGDTISFSNIDARNNTDYGISFGYATGITLTSFQCRSNGKGGVDIDRSELITVSNGFIYQNGWHGLGISYTNNSAFSAITFYDNSQVTANNWDNINIRTNSFNNTFTTINSQGTQQKYGFEEESPADYTVVTSSFFNGQTYGIEVQGANTKVNLCYNGTTWIP